MNKFPKIQRYFTNLRIKLEILSSGMFDKNFYSDQYPDTINSGVDPLTHYLEIGGFKGYDPNPTFSSRGYLEANPDVKCSGINPLFHYIKYGKNEGRKPQNLSALQEFISKHSHWEGDFSIPNQSTLNLHNPALTNWDGHRVNMFFNCGKLWILKNNFRTETIKREILFYSLAKGLFNTVEVKTINDFQCQELIHLGILPETATPFNSFVRRLAQDYSVEELPLKDLDLASAGEFVLSVWLRRNDPNEFNRAYIGDSVPVFFDTNACLNFEGGSNSIVKFTENKVRGHGGQWRIREKKSLGINHFSKREYPGQFMYFTVESIENFSSNVENIAREISMRKFDILNCVQEAGYVENEMFELTNLLVLNQKNLVDDVKYMLDYVFSNSSYTN